MRNTGKCQNRLSADVQDFQVAGVIEFLTRQDADGDIADLRERHLLPQIVRQTVSNLQRPVREHVFRIEQFEFEVARCGGRNDNCLLYTSDAADE